VFELRREAEQARDELLAGGFSRDEVQLSNADATGQTDSATGRPTAQIAEAPHDEGIGSSIKHFFKGIFGTDSSPHAQKYSDAVSRGHHVLVVNAADEPEIERAADIVERHGPVDIDEKATEWAGGAPVAHPESMRMSGAGGMQQSAQASAQSASGSAQSASQVPSGSTYQEPLGDSGILSASGASQQGASSSLQGSQQRDTSSNAGTAIPVIEERLKVGKREVQRGGVRVFSRVIATPVSESIGLREEHVNVERHKVDQPISTSDTAAFQEQRIEMRETAEEPVVEKTARVVEEVVVGKQVTERQQEISDTVRHTEVQVESLGTDAEADTAFRSHWSSNYASGGGRYDEYAPAYSYGSEMASSDKYRGRKWNDIEGDLRSDWDKRQGGGGASTWAKFKDAVKHGWDRITP
jgi:uncharacterized protein (TIGR02271 family)